MLASDVVATSERTADLIFLLSQAAHSLADGDDRRPGDRRDRRRASHCVLIKALEGDCTQIQLAERCALDKTTMVVTVDELEKAGLAERRPSPTDRRARIIAVTDAGADARAQAATRSSTRLYADVLGVAARRASATSFVDGARAAGRASGWRTRRSARSRVRRRASP